MGLLDKIFDKKDDGDRKASTPATSAPGSALRNDAPRADFSDVRGSSATSAPADASRRSYTVVAGDSLSKIAQREYGDASRWHAIYDANRDTISDPDLIHPGQVLTLPANS